MINTRTVKIIDVFEFDALVTETYNRPYSFQQQDGCKSRGIFYFTIPILAPEDFEAESIPEEVNGEEMGVSFAAWLARDPSDSVLSDGHPSTDSWEIELFWERNFYPHVDMILNDLYNRGMIENGEYAIDIDW